MGWVSCLEDAQERLDDILNYVEAVGTRIDGSKWSEVDSISKTLEKLQSQLEELVEIVTDPDIAPKIELNELRASYEQIKLENQNLQSRLSQEKSKNLKNRKIIQEQDNRLTAMAKRLKTEREIATHWSTKYCKEQNRREKAEAELEKFKTVETRNSSRKNKNKKRT